MLDAVTLDQPQLELELILSIVVDDRFHRII
jgi:hypothetical protein